MNDMTHTELKFYILKEEGVDTVKHFVEPLKAELNNALNAAKWGMKNGIVSLVNDTRTSTLYWEV